jgi:oligoribonuclease (3'-5' exoribonuclease)
MSSMKQKPYIKLEHIKVEHKKVGLFKKIKKVPKEKKEKERQSLDYTTKSNHVKNPSFSFQKSIT